MKFKVGDRVKVVNCYSGGEFDDGDIVAIAQIGSNDEDDVYGAISPRDGLMWYLCEDEVTSVECEYCCGKRPIDFYDAYDNAFINANGELSVTIDGSNRIFKLNFCPMCGRQFT